MTKELRIESNETIEKEDGDELGRGKFVGELASLTKDYSASKSYLEFY